MKKIIACTSMAVLLLTVVFVGEAYQDQEGTRVAEKNLVSKETGSGVPNWIKPDEEYLNYYDIGVFDTTLPILHINTNGQQISKENKIWSTIAVTDADVNGKARSVMEIPDYEADIMINYRGASSYSQFDKKQYRIKFYEEEGSTNAKEYEFLGMGKNS